MIDLPADRSAPIVPVSPTQRPPRRQIEDLGLPEELSAAAKAAGAAILACVRELNGKDKEIFTGGSRVFWSPEEWNQRGESYGLNSMLIVLHDCNALSPYFNLDMEQYFLAAAMTKALAEVGACSENCTTWYTAVYPLSQAKRS